MNARLPVARVTAGVRSEKARTEAMATCWVVLGIVACAVLSVARDLAVWGCRQERREVVARDAPAHRSPVPRSRGRLAGANGEFHAE